MKNNIVLIGMPGCGKSTVGVVLAKVLGYRFLDADLVIQEQEHRLLCEIIEQDGYEAFDRIENQVNTAISPQNTVIATGGSVVYGKEAMEHYRNIGVVVYLKLPYEEIAHRLGDLTKRGVSMKKGQTLQELYDERQPLYEQYADVVITETSHSIWETAFLIRDAAEPFLASRKDA